MIVLYLVLLIFFSYLLIKSTEILVGSLNRLSAASHFSKFALTSTFMAIATSLPELFVCITAALEKKSSLALGNVLGSNIADLSLVIGGVALISGSLGIIGEYLTKEMLAAFVAGLLPLVLLIDGQLTQVEGLLLLAVFGIYNFTVLSKRKKYVSPRGILKRINYKEKEKQLAWFFLGITLLLFSAEGIVKTAEQIAYSFNIPLLMIGIFLVGVGTSLPELAFEIGAARKKQVGLVFGDLLGSVVANSTLILGLTAFINPIVLADGFKPYFWATIAYLIIFSLFWLFSRTKKRLDRWEGLVLIIVYFIFLFWEFFRIGRISTVFFMTPIK